MPKAKAIQLPRDVTKLQREVKQLRTLVNSVLAIRCGATGATGPTGAGGPIGLMGVPDNGIEMQNIRKRLNVLETRLYIHSPSLADLHSHRADVRAGRDETSNFESEVADFMASSPGKKASDLPVTAPNNARDILKQLDFCTPVQLAIVTHFVAHACHVKGGDGMLTITIECHNHNKLRGR